MNTLCGRPKAPPTGRSEDIAGLSDEIGRMAAKGAASTVLALAENLPKIVDLTDQIAE